jgi:hypothetical protein
MRLLGKNNRNIWISGNTGNKIQAIQFTKK